MIVQALQEILAGASPVVDLVGDRIYPAQAPDAATFPLVVITKATGTGEYDLQGDVELESARAQIDCYAVTYAEVVELKTRVRRVLSAYQGGAGPSGSPCAIQGAFCINDSDLSESTTERAGPRLRRRMLEFRIWHSLI